MTNAQEAKQLMDSSRIFADGTRIGADETSQSEVSDGPPI
jgi:hypothetical protein